MTSSASPYNAPQHDLPILVGIGSPHADDQVGWIVAGTLAKRMGDDVHVRTTSVPLDLLNWIDESTQLHIIDACEGDQEPGHLYRWEFRNADFNEFPGQTSSLSHFSLRANGTHDFDVLSVLRLAHQLGRFPQSVTIWGIQGVYFAGAESELSAVADHVGEIVEVIAKELADARAITDALPAQTG